MGRNHVVDEFHRLYFDRYGDTFITTRWMGVPVFKVPADLWVYQELLYDLRPDFVIETGTFAGGSAIFMAQVMDAIGHGRIITVDIWDKGQAERELNAGYPSLSDRKGLRPDHPRLEYLQGDSVADGTIEALHRRIPSGAKVVVILDSCHDAAHVLREIELYKHFVPVGSYLIVEDTNADGNPIVMYNNHGPLQAVEAFLGASDAFVPDVGREKFMMTLNPSGYLMRVKEDPPGAG